MECFKTPGAFRHYLRFRWSEVKEFHDAKKRNLIRIILEDHPDYLTHLSLAGPTKEEMKSLCLELNEKGEFSWITASIKDIDLAKRLLTQYWFDRDWLREVDQNGDDFLLSCCRYNPVTLLLIDELKLEVQWDKMDRTGTNGLQLIAQSLSPTDDFSEFVSLFEEHIPEFSFKKDANGLNSYYHLFLHNLEKYQALWKELPRIQREKIRPSITEQLLDFGFSISELAPRMKYLKDEDSPCWRILFDRYWDRFNFNHIFTNRTKKFFEPFLIESHADFKKAQKIFLQMRMLMIGPEYEPHRLITGSRNVGRLGRSILTKVIDKEPFDETVFNNLLPLFLEPCHSQHYGHLYDIWIATMRSKRAFELFLAHPLVTIEHLVLFSNRTRRLGEYGPRMDYYTPYSLMDYLVGRRKTAMHDIFINSRWFSPEMYEECQGYCKRQGIRMATEFEKAHRFRHNDDQLLYSQLFEEGIVV